MDEAERCHKLAYIAYGTLLATGTAREIVAAQGLSTLAVRGEGLAHLAARLQALPDVAQTVMFGVALHVSGTDAAGLLATVTREAHGCEVTPVETGLEDVFIYMMHRSQDDFGARA